MSATLLGDAGQWGRPDHAALGARYLQQWLPADVVEPIRLHVDAKRYLVATDPGYAAMLSPASIETLRQQGGPLTSDEAAAFAASPHAEAAIALRKCDDGGKLAEAVDVPPLEHYRPTLASALT